MLSDPDGALWPGDRSSSHRSAATPPDVATPPNGVERKPGLRLQRPRELGGSTVWDDPLDDGWDTAPTTQPTQRLELRTGPNTRFVPPPGHRPAADRHAITPPRPQRAARAPVPAPAPRRQRPVAPWPEPAAAPAPSWDEGGWAQPHEADPWAERPPGLVLGRPAPVLSSPIEDHPDLDGLFGDDDEFVDQTSVVTRNALEWAVVLVGAVLVALVLRALVFQAFYIPSESMESTLLVNDRVLVNKVSYHLHDVHRGDVVVFERPENDPGEIRDLIKRVIALPGETIEIRDNSVYIDGRRLMEPYVDEGTLMDDHGPIVVPEGHLFVMGDNRDESQDSRWFGPIDQELVVGRAFVLFWPVDRTGSL